MVFIFQACYGSPQDMKYDMFIEGLVKASATGEPIQGIKVSLTDTDQYEFTDEMGKFSFYTDLSGSYPILFEDTDGGQNGVFMAVDTVLIPENNSVYFEMLLDRP
jgi:hypothetical protein